MFLTIKLYLHFNCVLMLKTVLFEMELYLLSTELLYIELF